ncbi:MAG: beta-ketoacyl-ACP synthase II [Planctomycetes bacterium]|nr:beta-ketoacyl-ACP synthase II [Planctomycetota bacterium]
MARRRVVITGLGTINPLGHCVREFWDALISCKSGIRGITRIDVTSFDSRIGGQVQNWDPAAPPDRIDPRESKRMDRFVQFAVASSYEAVKDAGLDFSRENTDNCGVVVGSGIGGLQELEEQHERMLTRGLSRTSPFTVPKLMGNAASGHVAIAFGLKGPNFAVVTACASAANSIGEALRIIQHGEADVMITGGSEAALTLLGVSSFCSLRGLSCRNDQPEKASRPFDKDRDGFLLAEGAGCVVLESLEHARARSAKICCELVGYGSSCDAHHITAPDPEGYGAILAMKKALKDAAMNPSDIQYINAHGTSTQLGDLAETKALKLTFGDWAKAGLMVSSTKSSTGHLLGASGGVELIACVKAIETGIIPATLNLDNPDPECDLDYVPLHPRQKKVDVIMSNSFGFGGHNGVLIVKRFNG